MCLWKVAHVPFSNEQHLVCTTLISHNDWPTTTTINCLLSAHLRDSHWPITTPIPFWVSVIFFPFFLYLYICILSPKMQSIIFITACMAFYVPLPHSPPYDCRICLCKSDQSGRFVSFRWWWCWCLRFVSIIFHCQTLTETSVIEEEDDEGETLKTLSFTYNSVYVWFTCTTNFISHIILVHSHRDPHTLSAFYSIKYIVIQLNVHWVPIYSYHSLTQFATHQRHHLKACLFCRMANCLNVHIVKYIVNSHQYIFPMFGNLGKFNLICKDIYISAYIFTYTRLHYLSSSCPCPVYQSIRNGIDVRTFPIRRWCKLTKWCDVEI